MSCVKCNNHRFVERHLVSQLNHSDRITRPSLTFVRPTPGRSVGRVPQPPQLNSLAATSSAARLFTPTARLLESFPPSCTGLVNRPCGIPGVLTHSIITMSSFNYFCCSRYRYYCCYSGSIILTVGSINHPPPPPTSNPHQSVLQDNYTLTIITTLM